MKKVWIKNWFSNMLPLDEPFIYQGIVFRSVENFYQAMKVLDIEERRRIAALSPQKSKIEGRKLKVRADWDKIKLDVMEFALRKKFAPGTSWFKRLMEESGEIVERNNWGDVFWGWDVEKEKGENHLGKLLMKIRDNN